MIVDIRTGRDPRAVQPSSRAQRARQMIARAAPLIIAHSGRARPSLTLYGPDYDALAAEQVEGAELYWGRLRILRTPDPDHSTIY